jgi:uncharacterized protein (DUF2336 family)
MAANANNFALLLDLAKEGSSEKRRELLRQITDVFLAQPSNRSEKEAVLFDEIVSAVASNLETQVRIELSHKIADTVAPLRHTARRLAMDEIAVARPVLERSRALTDDDLVEVINKKTQDHMLAVTKRPDIGEKVSSALVNKGEDHIVVSLLQNATAKIDHKTYARVAERAEASPVLHAPLVRNANVPLDILNKVYLRVELDLRREIMRKFHGVSPAELEAALEVSRTHLSAAYGALPLDYPHAREHITKLTQAGTLNPAMLVQLLREEHHTAFLIAFAQLVDVDFELGQRLVEAQDLDALAMLCRGAGFDRGLFVTICVMIGDGEGGLSKTEEYGQIYELVPVAAAQRALRFWKVRAKNSNAQAA